jgi:hypothetical protein
VPAGSPTLQFETRYQIEPGFDFGFVQVSTDGGATFTSLGNADTTSQVDPTAIATVRENLPGFTGNSGGGAQPAWIETTFDLADYAGQTVLLAFRYVTDSGVDLPGWWVDNVRVGGTLLADGTSLAGWRSATEVSPDPVSGFTVQLVGYSTRRVNGRPLFPAVIYRLPLGPDNNGQMNRIDVIRHLTPLVDVVAAIVTYDEPTETATQYAPYTLTVNGVVQPGGS